MNFAVIRFSLAALIWGFWLPGLVHTVITITHNATTRDEDGYVLPEDSFTIQCSVQQNDEDTWLYISTPTVFNCMGCRKQGIGGNTNCDTLVDRQNCSVENGYIYATMIVYNNPDILGPYTCRYDGAIKSIVMKQRDPADSVALVPLNNECNIIELNGICSFECKTSCPVVPDPLYAWTGHKTYENITNVTLPCTNEPTNTVAGSQLTIGWQQTDHSSNNITYECCETDGNMCDDITVAHGTVSASYVFSPDNGTLELYPGESMILNCTTDCPLAPLPQLIWLNETKSWSESVSCGDDGRYLSVVSHLKVNWTGSATEEEINIDYICCTSDSLLCTNITVSHVYSPPTSDSSTVQDSTTAANDSATESLPEARPLSTGEKVGIGIGCATILALTTLILVCCCREGCPWYTCCRNPTPNDTAPQSTEPHNNKDHTPHQISMNSYSQKADN